VPAKELNPPDPTQVVELFRLGEESDPELANFIVLAASSGARRGELLALRWDDVDFDRRTLSIERGIVLVDGDLIEQSTKTHQSRWISLDAGTVTALKEHQGRAMDKAHASSCVLNPQGFVFSHSVDGSLPWHPDSTSRAFRRVCQQAG
jgi:integrase